MGGVQSVQQGAYPGTVLDGLGFHPAPLVQHLLPLEPGCWCMCPRNISQTESPLLSLTEEVIYSVHLGPAWS